MPQKDGEKLFPRTREIGKSRAKTVPYEKVATERWRMVGAKSVGQSPLLDACLPCDSDSSRNRRQRAKFTNSLNSHTSLQPDPATGFCCIFEFGAACNCLVSPRSTADTVYVERSVVQSPCLRYAASTHRLGTAQGASSIRAACHGNAIPPVGEVCGLTRPKQAALGGTKLVAAADNCFRTTQAAELLCHQDL